VVEEGFDLAVRIGDVRSQALIARRIGTTTLVCTAAPSYLERHPPPRVAADLAGHACLTYAYAPDRNVWRFRDASGAAHAVSVTGPVHANHGENDHGAEPRGRGRAFRAGHRWVAPYVRTGALVALLEGFEGPSLPIHASIRAVATSRPRCAASSTSSQRGSGTNRGGSRDEGQGSWIFRRRPVHRPPGPQAAGLRPPAE
jgi:hypothetical protein